MKNSDYKKKAVDSWFSFLQSQICNEFEIIEGRRKRFVKRHWKKKRKRKAAVFHIC